MDNHKLEEPYSDYVKSSKRTIFIFIAQHIQCLNTHFFAYDLVLVEGSREKINGKLVMEKTPGIT